VLVLGIGWQKKARRPLRHVPICVHMKARFQIVAKPTPAPALKWRGTLEQKLRMLEALPEIQVSDCQDSFLRNAVPAKYQKLGIQVASLITYFENIYGENRDNWPKHSDIQDFIKIQYQAELAPNILNRLRDKNPETLKNYILRLAASDPDIGLKLLEL